MIATINPPTGLTSTARDFVVSALREEETKKGGALRPRADSTSSGSLTIDKPRQRRRRFEPVAPDTKLGTSEAKVNDNQEPSVSSFSARRNSRSRRNSNSRPRLRRPSDVVNDLAYDADADADDETVQKAAKKKRKARRRRRRANRQLCTRLKRSKRPIKVNIEVVPDNEVVLRHLAHHICDWVQVQPAPRPRCNSRFDLTDSESPVASPQAGKIARSNSGRLNLDPLALDIDNFTSDAANVAPSPDGIVNTFSWIFRVLQVEQECSIVIAVYVQRLIARGVILTSRNYEPILVACILLATKMWDDLSTINDDFVQALPHYTLRNLNKLEALVVQSLGWTLHVTREEYAKFYADLTKPYVTKCGCIVEQLAKPDAGHFQPFPKIARSPRKHTKSPSSSTSSDDTSSTNTDSDNSEGEMTDPKNESNNKPPKKAVTVAVMLPLWADKVRHSTSASNLGRSSTPLPEIEICENVSSDGDTELGSGHHEPVLPQVSPSQLLLKPLRRAIGMRAPPRQVSMTPLLNLKF